MKQLARFNVTAISGISQSAGIISIFFLLALVLLTVSDVILRYFFKSSILGHVELAEYGMIVAGFLGLGWCALQGGHLKVDMIVSRFTPRFQAITDSITLFLGLTVIPIVAWQSFEYASYQQAAGATSDMLDIPAYPFYIVVGIGFTLLSLAMVVLLVRLVRKTVEK